MSDADILARYGIGGKKQRGRSTDAAILKKYGAGQPILGGLAADSGTNPNMPEPVAKGVSKALDLMSRPGEAAMHVYARPDSHHPDVLGALGVFAHGEAPEQYTTDTENALRQIMPYDKLPGWARTGARLGMQTVGDPTTAVGGSGLARHGVEAALEHSVPLAMRASKALLKRAPQAEGDVNAIGSLHDITTPGGQPFAHALRTQALEKGRAGVQDWQKQYAIWHATKAAGEDISGKLTTAFRRSISGLSNDDRMAVYRAIDEGKTAELPQHLRERAEQIEHLTDVPAYLRGTPKLRASLAPGDEFKLPEGLADYDRVRGIQKATKYRGRYVPKPHDLTPEQGAAMQQKVNTIKRTGFSITGRDPHLLQRAADTALADDPTIYDEAFEHMFRKAGEDIAGHDTRQLLAEMFAPQKPMGRRLLTPSDIARTPQRFDQQALPGFRGLQPTTRGMKTGQRYADVPQHIRQMFEPRETPLTGLEKWADNSALYQLFRKGSQLGKSSLFVSPLPHMRNIAGLTLLHEPGAIPGAIANYVRTRGGTLGKAETLAKAREKVIGPAMRAGAAHAPNIEQTGLVKLLDKMGPAGRAAGHWYDKSGNLLWGWDDASKAAVWSRYAKRYKDPFIAAYHAQRDLVDYSLQSPLTDAMRVVAPFATWRTQLPASVVRGILKNPQNALFLDRLSQGRAFGAKQKDATGTTQYRTSLAEGLQPFQDPKAYLRGTLGPTGKIAAEALSQPFAGKRASDYDRRYFTYGEHLLPYKKRGKLDLGFLLNEMPWVGQALQYSGHGMFSESPKDSLLYQLLGREHYGP